MTTTNAKQVKMNIMTQAQYDAITPSPTELYTLTDADVITVDQTFDGTSTNAQSGVAIAGALSGYALASSLATVATSGSYVDLSNKPTIPTDTADLINGAGFLTSSDLTDGSLDAAFYESLSIGGVSSFYDSEEDILSISGSPIKIGEAVTIRTETDGETGENNLLITDDITADNIQFSSQGGISVDTSTSGGEFTYNGSEVATLSDIPSIPTVNNATLTIQKNGTTVNTFTANASTDVTANITVPTDLGDLTNNAGYTKNVGTVTSVNNVQPVNGNVTLSIPAEGANKDLSNLTATGEAHFQEPISDLATIRSGASAGATAVQPSDITDVVRQETTDTLYCWYNANSVLAPRLYTYTITLTDGVSYPLYNNRGKPAIYGDGVYNSSNNSFLVDSLGDNEYIRQQSDDIQFRSTLTDNNSNALNITQADGQWVSNWVQLASGVTYPTSNDITYSLASYLPNDGYNYDVLFGAQVNTGSTSGNVCAVSLSTDIQTDSVTITGCRTRTSSTVTSYGSVRLPVGTNRNVIVVANSSRTGTFALHFIGYRRLGTNL